MSNIRTPARDKIRGSISIGGSFHTKIRRHKPSTRPPRQIFSSKALTMARPRSVPLMTVGASVVKMDSMAVNLQEAVQNIGGRCLPS
jgi:hypothetical protein